MTQLTSVSQAVLHEELLIPGEMDEVVAKYATNAQAAGLDGVVCSPLEVEIVKEWCGQDFMAVTPGIRYPEGSVGDQSRVTTPQKAAALGSDFIVMGRPITAANDPVAAYRRAISDFAGA